MSINYTSSYQTELSAVVVIPPNQLNNDLYFNIKRNLEKRFLNRVYKNYGLIEKIYNIKEVGEGKINKENNNADVYFDVKFNCRLIRPTINSIIIAKVIALNNEFIILKCGNIKIMIKNKKINDKYVIDNIKGIYKNKETNEEIKLGDYFKIQIYKYQMINKETTIYANGSLIDDATKEEVEEYYNKYYNEIENDNEIEKNINKDFNIDN